MPYTTIVTEGGLLPADILDAIAAGELEGQRPEDFGLERTRNLSDRISAAWQAARGQWALFQSYLADLPAGETATSETREQWVLPLLRVLGYQLARNRSAYVVQGRSYAVSHRAGANESDDAPPIHIESIRNSLDARPPSGRPRLSPHALVQEYLNATEQLWGIVTNGERLRLLRDSSRFTRPAYVEFDLRAIMEGEQFSAFALLYRLLHRSRLPVGADEAAGCLLERYHQRAVEAGGRVREGLRDGVESALKRLGDGLLRHPANAELRAKLAKGLETGSDGDGSLTPLGYYRQLLRLVYRLLFLMVAEERGLIAAAHDEDEGDILSPAAYRPGPDRRLAIYREHYSVSRLRRLAETSGAGRGPYTDLWDGLLTTFRLLEGSDEVAPRRLGLAPLDGDLFGDAACAALTTGTRLTNAELLAAMRSLSLYREKESKALRRVNYGALDVEELGSVYESLLDYRPVIRAEGGRLMADVSGTSALSPQPSAFDLVSGTERKTTGSYYTRPELVQELIKSALVPVLEDRLRAAREQLRAEPSGSGKHQPSALSPQPFEKGPGDKERGHQPSALSPQPFEEEAILSIRVCDPACGSGAFLLAAARRLGRELARVRAGEDQPSPTQFRRAVRDVIRRCIFGVDLNPLAVDLCKLALWLEGHAAGLPLSFLDHHIRHGNSLVGATRALVEAGVPDEAYKPVTGDDKPTASSIRKRNRQERDLYLKQGMVQHDLFGAAAPDHAPFAAALRALDEAADDSVAAVRARAARYAALRSTASPERAKFDLWTAAFFQPLTPANARYVPTSKDLIDFDPAGEQALMAAALAEEVGFFHWELEFPQVFEGQRAEGSGLRAAGREPQPSAFSPQPSAGFDVVLGNPPWEQVELKEEEHFVDVPEITGAANKASRDKVITAWRQGDERQRTRIAQFDAAKYRAEAERRFIGNSNRFPLTATGRFNTYALFSEHSRSLLAPLGRTGIIVPSGIVTDNNTKEFFQDLLQTRTISAMFGMDNEEMLFPGIDHRNYFGLLCMNGSNAQVKAPVFTFSCSNVDLIYLESRRFSLSMEDIALLNPNSFTCPVFRTNADADLAKSIYREIPVLYNSRTNTRRWDITFRQGLFNMAVDSGVFLKEHELGSLPLYEAKMIYHYDHRYASYAGATAANLKEGSLPQSSTQQKQDPTLQVLPNYWVEIESVKKQLGAWKRDWLLLFRDIARASNERTAIFSVTPIVGVGHTAPIVFFGNEVQQRHIACFISCANSLVFDFLARQKVGGTHLTFTILNQLPILPPDRFTPDDIAFIVPRVVELVYTAWDIRAFAEDVWAEGDEALRAELLRRNAACNVGAPRELFPATPGVREDGSVDFTILHSPFSIPPYRWDDARRALARAELDARIARLYGLTRDELRYILDPHDVYGPEFPGETFRVLKEKETKLYGEYRTRRLVLEAWDREGVD